jgi:hypothetical protein
MKKVHHQGLLGQKGEHLPLTRMNPPNTIKIRTTNGPKKFETVMLLAAPAMNRNSDSDI